MPQLTPRARLQSMAESISLGWPNDPEKINDYAREYFNDPSAEVDEEGDIWRRGAWACDDDIRAFCDWLDS